MEFMGKYPKKNKTIETTCRKLHEKYPKPEDGEMFIRSQMVMRVPVSYEVEGKVLNFTHFIRDLHDEVYREYKERHVEMVSEFCHTAKVEVSKILEKRKKQTRLPKGAFITIPEPKSLMGRYLLGLEDGTLATQLELQEQVAIKCLRWPLLARLFDLTEHTRERIRMYRRAVNLRPIITYANKKRK